MLLHAGRGVLRPGHEGPSLQSRVKLLRHGDVGVWASTWNKTLPVRGAGSDWFTLVITDVYWFSWFTQREDLPQYDSIGPDVALTAVNVLENALWSHPLHGQEALDRGEPVSFLAFTEGQFFNVLISLKMRFSMRMGVCGPSALKTSLTMTPTTP